MSDPVSDAVPGVGRQLRLPAPFDGEALLGFLRPRALPGVEVVEERAYARTLPAVLGPGHLRVALHGAGAELTVTRGAASAAAGERAARLLDLETDPVAVARVLEADPILRPLVARRPGLRVPGAFDGFEVAVRAILGQQVSIAGATTLAGRLIAALGEPLAGAPRGLGRSFPAPERLAESGLEGVGLTRSRTLALRALARAVAGGELRLEPGEPAASLLELPGVGPWTAAYIGMRALGDRDAIPLTDLGLRRAWQRLGGDARPAALAARAEGWRPYRAYAAVQLWLAP